MATLTELRNLFGDGALLKKVEAAICIAAAEVAAGDDNVPPYDQAAGRHDDRVKWAQAALRNTQDEAARMWKVVLANNQAATVTQIQGAPDATIVSQVKAAVDLVAFGMNA